MRSRRFGASATTNVPSAATGERGRIDDAARFRADLHDLPRARLLFVEPIHGVAAAIEDEVLAGGGLLKAGDLAKPAGDVRGHGAR
jgi:hypothetical protein